MHQPTGPARWRVRLQVGIIPTDTLPAIVCDLENRDAVLRLYAVKGMDPKKPLSLLCRDFRDISHYTSGFPNSNIPGQPNFFNLVRRLLPGPVRWRGGGRGAPVWQAQEEAWAWIGAEGDGRSRIVHHVAHVRCPAALCVFTRPHRGHPTQRLSPNNNHMS